MQEVTGGGDHRPQVEESALIDDAGLTLLEVSSPRSTVVHRLVCDRLAAMAGRSAYWIDARNTASTHALYEHAPSRRTLAGLEIARAFTAYQHHSLVREVVRRAGSGAGLVVAPNVASLYQDPDLPSWEREDLLAASLETLSALSAALECPVVVTTADGDAAETVADYADATVECVQTREGVRLEGEDDEPFTAGYWHGRYWQTTIPYWADLFGTVETVEPVVDAPVPEQRSLEVGL
ncbi:hypothetical protein [Natrarchaeobaculum aegyptiacum]|uniref:DNA recombination and repair protein Rad51-like C-terminal domain-containing protein n=1 Tax=Natrarchaeobaculum aegyptiacum TaxID=745377 RepID=A0A2Z2HZH4_9EURY|nr:hypothetical protein [Natrarchaeobaculum aegyptiacum]ARS89128.1 hypothetical protein B1756_04715 [Natrarchaeobaculum aegyptiacum]